MIDGEDDHEEGRHHGEFALGEIDHVGRAKDQHEAERDERIDRADADALEEELEDEIHERAYLTAAANLAFPPASCPRLSRASTPFRAAVA